MKCYDCPRKCGVDRKSQKGFCGESDKIRVAKVIENFAWEEPCISGEKGALAIFFSGCNLRCEFCQNYKLSHVGYGDEYSPKKFRAWLEKIDLDKYSCIDLITPSHFSSALIEALKDFDCPIPIVWNSSGYESEEMIEKLAKVVDVFLPDFKYYSSELSFRFSKSKDYFDVASKAIKKMSTLKKNIFSNGQMIEGVLIRHLVLPGFKDDSIKILEFIHNEINNPYISLMSQFTPTKGDIKRKLFPLEYKIVLSHADKLGLKNGYIQEFESASDDFIPEF